MRIMLIKHYRMDTKRRALGVRAPSLIKNTSRAAARPLGRARRLGALRYWGRGGGAFGLELFAAALAVGGLEGGDLGLVRVQVRDEGGARRVDVGLEAFVGVVRKEVPVSTGVDAPHHALGHAEHLFFCAFNRIHFAMSSRSQSELSHCQLNLPFSELASDFPRYLELPHGAHSGGSDSNPSSTDFYSVKLLNIFTTLSTQIE
jgi:hypothetical protein